MSEKVLAALKTAPSTTELREMDLPDMPPDAALMKVEVAGVCGTDVSQYKLPLRGGAAHHGARERRLPRARRQRVRQATRG